MPITVSRRQQEQEVSTEPTSLRVGDRVVVCDDSLKSDGRTGVIIAEWDGTEYGPPAAAPGWTVKMDDGGAEMRFDKAHIRSAK